MNTLKIIIVAGLFVFVCSLFVKFGYTENIAYYPLAENEVSEIQIDIEDAEIDIITADTNDFTVKFKVNPQDEKLSTYYSIVEDGKLLVSQYKLLQERSYNTKPKVEITVPINADIKDLNIKTKSGRVLLEEVNPDKFNIETEGGKVDIKNLMSTNGKVKTTNGTITLTDVTSPLMEIESKTGNVEVNKIISDILQIKISEKSVLNINEIVASKVLVQAPKTKVAVELSDQIQYKLIVPSNVKSEDISVHKQVQLVTNQDEINKIAKTIESEISELSKASGVSGNDGIEYYYIQNAATLEVKIIGESTEN